MLVSKPPTLDDWVDELDLEDVLKADGYDDAVIGIVIGCAQPTRLVYDTNRIIEILMGRDRMNREEAEEFFDFNIAGAYHGAGTPLFLTSRFPGYRQHKEVYKPALSKPKLDQKDWAKDFSGRLKRTYGLTLADIDSAMLDQLRIAGMSPAEAVDALGEKYNLEPTPATKPPPGRRRMRRAGRNNH